MVLEHGEVLVVGSKTPEVVAALGRRTPDQRIVDLVRLPAAAQLRDGKGYRGIAW